MNFKKERNKSLSKVAEQAVLISWVSKDEIPFIKPVLLNFLLLLIILKIFIVKFKLKIPTLVSLLVTSTLIMSPGFLREIQMLKVCYLTNYSIP